MQEQRAREKYISQAEHILTKSTLVVVVFVVVVVVVVVV